MNRGQRLSLIAALLLSSVLPSAAQKPTVRSLRPPDAILVEEFTRLISVRELSDGRVLLSDNRDNRVVVADFRSGNVTPIGRVGSGPAEYRRAGPLIAIGRDSTILTDPGNGRWLLLAGSRVVETLAPDAQVVLAAPIPSGGDAKGQVLGQHIVRKPDGGFDSVAVLLIARATGRGDTIARLAPQRVRVEPARRVGIDQVTVQTLRIPGFSAGEQAILFPDGWVGIARLNPYRVEWRASDGRRVRGEALPFTRPPMDDREKGAYIERLASQTGGVPSVAETDWPDQVPPFTSVSSVLGAPAPALFTTPDGHLLVRRVPTSSTPLSYYDVVNRSGMLDGQLVLEPTERVLGYGARSIYVVVTSADGIERLQRHPWP